MAFVGAAASAAAGDVTIQKPWMHNVIWERPAVGYFVLQNDTTTTKKVAGSHTHQIVMALPEPTIFVGFLVALLQGIGQ